jgi:hypothetical protein
MCDPAFGKTAVQQLLEQGNGTTNLGVLNELIGDLPIGGNSYSNGSNNVLLRNEIIQAIENTQGVVGVSLTTPSENVSVSPFRILVPPSSWSITYVDTVVT